MSGPERIGPRQLVRLTAAKTVANTALRWIPPFLPTLATAFATSTTTLTTVLGIGELAGLTTLAPRRQLDRGRERVVMAAALAMVSLSAVIALGGSVPVFAVAYVVLVAGVANFTVAGHAWISHRVPYYRRARSIGVFETSWALALLLGAPLVALLISAFGWRGPFIAIAAAAAVASAVTARPTRTVDAVVSAPGPAAEPPSGRSARLTRPAGLVIAGVSLLAAAGLSVFVVSGTWLSDAFDVSTGGLGLVAMGLGAVELTASIGSASFADRAGKRHSVLAGIGGVLVGLIVMASAGDALALGVLGLLIFLLGFEFAFVTSLSLLSEAMPTARGATLALGNAVATTTRAAGMVIGGLLYGAHGIIGTVAFSAGAASVALACFAAGRGPSRPQ